MLGAAVAGGLIRIDRKHAAFAPMPQNPMAVTPPFGRPSSTPGMGGCFGRPAETSRAARHAPRTPGQANGWSMAGEGGVNQAAPFSVTKKWSSSRTPKRSGTTIIGSSLAHMPGASGVASPRTR